MKRRNNDNDWLMRTVPGALVGALLFWGIYWLASRDGQQSENAASSPRAQTQRPAAQAPRITPEEHARAARATAAKYAKSARVETARERAAINSGRDQPSGEDVFDSLAPGRNNSRPLPPSIDGANRSGIPFNNRPAVPWESDTADPKKPPAPEWKELAKLKLMDGDENKTVRFSAYEPFRIRVVSGEVSVRTKPLRASEYYGEKLSGVFVGPFQTQTVLSPGTHELAIRVALSDAVVIVEQQGRIDEAKQPAP